MTDKINISLPISLLETRDKIDAIDSEIHQLLMRRADLVQNVQKAKEAEGPIVNAMHADREIEMFRRFSANHSGCLPLASLQRMFREMIATFSHLQCPFKVFVLKGEALHRDTARYFYGTVIEIVECENVASLLSQVQAPTSDIVLLPASAQALDEFAKITQQGCQIFARLPFWDDGAAYGLELPDMFVIGHAPLKTVGNDYTVFKANKGADIVLPLLENAGYELMSYYEHAGNIYCVIKAFAIVEGDSWRSLKNSLAQKDIVVDFLGIYGKV
ncbi:MAG: chorismate mutase [Rhizobiales bacterium]|nr:chorismate mutase [Hyphomicrobiales bacterium]NRB14707.1 chorismate mutase [Hyphomicrobiales bacterium]